MTTGTYLERLRSEFDDITAGIESVLERAANESRDLTTEENAQIEREDARRDELQRAIDVQARLLERQAKVSDVLGRVRPVSRGAATSSTPPADEFDLAREGIQTPGQYAALIHRAWVKKDRDAIDLLERATAHQKLADNPGLVPRPIVGPVVDRLRAMRPFIAAVGVNPAPAPKFDRPKVTQNVDVDEQSAEKASTGSQKMITAPVEVALKTYAGHLNISKQDVRWTQPSILDLVFASFGKVYARRTDKAACAAFVAAVSATQDVDTLDATGFDAALGAAGQTIGGTDGDLGEPNTVYMSRDVAVKIGSLRNPTTGLKLYNVPVIGGLTGDMDGLNVVIDPRFAADTLIVGDNSLVEYWEDLEGFLSVDEPDVLGQLVGYAGYGALAVLDAAGFVKLTLPAETP